MTWQGVEDSTAHKSTGTSNEPTQINQKSGVWPSLFSFSMFPKGPNTASPNHMQVATSPLQVMKLGPTCWPRDLLKSDVPKSRILTYGYKSELLRFFGAASQNNIYSHARNLLYDLIDQRQQCVSFLRIETSLFSNAVTSNLQKSDRPIIWIVHSLGGLIVKEVGNVSRTQDGC